MGSPLASFMDRSRPDGGDSFLAEKIRSEEHPREESPDVRPPSDPAPLRGGEQRKRPIEKLADEPKGEKQNRWNGDDGHNEEDRDECEHCRVWIHLHISPQNPRDGPRCADGGDHRAGIGQDMKRHRTQPTG